MFDSDIKPSLSKVTQALNYHNVEYMVIGGLAVAAYGFHRLSGAYSSMHVEIKPDLDFWYRPTLQNFTNLQRALVGIGVAEEKLLPIIFNKTNYLKIDHGKFKTDFLPILTGLDSFELSMNKAKKIDFAGETLYIIAYEDLVKNKEAINREVDRNDIDRLHKIKKDKGSSLS